MSKNTQEIPFTELVERCQKLARIPDNAVEKIRGVIQDVYLREIPSKEDWNFLLTSSSLTTQEEYKTGTVVTANTGSTTTTFSSDVLFDATFTGRKLKMSGADPVYSVTFLQTTGLTLQIAHQGTVNISGASYTIFQDQYALPKDFDRFPTNGGLYKWEGGQKKPLEELFYQETFNEFSATPSTPEKITVFGENTAGEPLIQFFPPPKYARVYNYDYIRRLRPLIQSTGLLLSLSANATAVLGIPGRAKFNEATTGDWLRVDELGKGQDSEWFRIIAISHDSSLTLGSAFANTAITSSANFTIARAPEMPARLHPAVLYGALKYLLQDQNDPQFQVYMQRFAEVVAEGKRIFTQRVSPQEFDTIATDFNFRR